MDTGLFRISWPFGCSRNFYPRLERLTLVCLVRLVHLLYSSKKDEIISKFVCWGSIDFQFDFNFELFYIDQVERKHLYGSLLGIALVGIAAYGCEANQPTQQNKLQETPLERTFSNTATTTPEPTLTETPQLTFTVEPLPLDTPLPEALTEAERREKGIIYWVFAHPDDETLAGGGALWRYKQEGYRNVVIIVSSGERTAVGTRLGLTPQETGIARRMETEAALEHVGVDEINFLGIPEGEVTKEFVEDYLVSLNDIENAVVMGHSPYDSYLNLQCGHIDHCVIGNALVELWKQGKIKELNLYRIGHFFDGSYGDVCSYLSEQEFAVKQRMGSEYAYVDRSLGRYGIGAQSVPEAWQKTEQEPECFDLPK